MEKETLNKRLTRKLEDGTYTMVLLEPKEDFQYHLNLAYQKLGQLEDFMEEKNLKVSDFKDIEPLGRVVNEKNKLFITSFVGTAKNDNYNFELLVGTDMSPILRYKHINFLLSWQSIICLAELKGFFNEIDNLNKSKEGSNDEE